MPVIRKNCPVCLGLSMAIVRPSKEVEVMLDYCQRCGGMWFDQGEVDQLRKCRPEALNTAIVLTEEARRMSCHSCQTIMVRNDDRCPACGWLNRLPCPGCAAELKPTEQDQLKLDVCSRCHGIWFDNTELAQIWNVAVASFTAGEAQKSEPEPRDRFFLDSVLNLFILDGVFPSGAVHAVGDVIGSLPEAAGSIVQGAGGFAGSIFEELAPASGDVVDVTGAVSGEVFDGIGSIFDIFNF